MTDGSSPHDGGRRRSRLESHDVLDELAPLSGREIRDLGVSVIGSIGRRLGRRVRRASRREARVRLPVMVKTCRVP